ncbi:MAG: twin-arginine translocation pathway signal protein [Pseudomonadota bacterium]
MTFAITQARAGLSAALLAGAALASCSPSAEAPEAETTVQVASEDNFVAADFAVPTLVETEGFKIVPLGPDLAEIDYEAYMSSIEHLQETFTRSTGWPNEGLTDEDAIKDMETEAARFEARTSFAYAVLTPDGTRELGCIYVYPSPVDGYDAMVRLWVTKAEFDAGFDEELYAWAQEWVAKDWPFESVAYPGRAITWEEWDALTAPAEES